MDSSRHPIELTESEKTVLNIINELEKREKNPETNEITISNELKITLSEEGIKKLKMISEKNIDSDSAIKSLKERSLLLNNRVDLELSELGKDFCKKLRSEQLSNWYNDNLLRNVKSQAYASFCEQVYGKNLAQYNVFDMHQLNALISSFNLKSTDLVLDLGCGLGKITEYVQHHSGAKIIGLDFAEKLLTWARANTQAKEGKLVFQVGDFDNLDFASSTFDAIYAIDTLYPWFIGSLDKTIAKISDILKPSGQVGIFLAQIIESKKDSYLLDPSSTEIAQALSNQGFNFSTIDFTANARSIWVKEIEIGNKLKKMFEEEGNLDLCEELINDGKRWLHRNDNNLQKRYFYHAFKKH